MHITWIFMNWSDPGSSTSQCTHLFQETLKSGRASNYSQHTTPQAHLPLQPEQMALKRACTLTLICHCPWRQTQPSRNTTDFQIPKGGQASSHPHALVHASLSPWNVNPAYLQGILLPVLWNIIVLPPSWIFLWSLSKLQMSPLPCS